MSRPVPNPGILDIAPYTPGKSPVPEPGRKVFKLSANETPFGPSPKAPREPSPSENPAVA